MVKEIPVATVDGTDLLKLNKQSRRAVIFIGGRVLRPVNCGNVFNSYPPGQNSCHFADHVFRCLFVNEICAEKAASHYLNQCVHRSLTHICDTMGVWCVGVCGVWVWVGVGGGDGGLNAFDIDMSWCRVFNGRLSSREFNRTSAIIHKYM